MEIPNRVCIIGAGVSGLAACRALKEAAIPFDCYEASDRVGGLWVYNNSNGMSSVYQSLHINTSKDKMHFSGYPMPEDYPNFPHHSLIAEYFNNFAEHFHLKPHIQFNTKVINAKPLDGGGWEITLQDHTTQRYRALIVANGHHWHPQWPTPAFPGEFHGKVTHTHYYKTPDAYVNKRVLVVGFGNSAMDIAVEVSRVAAKTYLSVRRGFYVTPKHVLGKPLDHAPVPDWLPFEWRSKLGELALKVQIGDLAQFGLPKPDYPYMHAHPIINSEILSRLAHGDILPKPNIQQLDGDDVVFVDESREPIDAIIYGTGYKIAFPFFQPEVLTVRDNELPLFRHIFHPRYPDLLFVGLLQPNGAVSRIAEVQSQWISRYLVGNYHLPSAAAMEQDIDQEREIIQQRFGGSLRHTMQVDFASYVRMVGRELRQGSKRSPTPEPLIRVSHPVDVSSPKIPRVKRFLLTPRSYSGN